ncbi:unnamed protein product, partial [Thlaspi arvense]
VFESKRSVMATISSTLLLNSRSVLPPRFTKLSGFSSPSPFPRSCRFRHRILESFPDGTLSPGSRAGGAMAATSVHGVVTETMKLIQSASPTWKSAVANNLLIFVLGSPLLVTGLSASGIAAAFLLGTLTWRAYGSAGFLLVAAYFVIGTAATKVKMSEKEAQGVAEKKKGRRGPRSVIGSSAAGCVCAFLSIYQVGGAAFSQLFRLGFVSSFCTKVSDTVSSEIGKAYGKTTFDLFCNASVGCFLGQITPPEAAVCVLASQIANLGESIIGASFQDKEGFEWLNNDVVNVINISLGSIVAILMQQFILQNWV